MENSEKPDNAEQKDIQNPELDPFLEEDDYESLNDALCGESDGERGSSDYDTDIDVPDPNPTPYDVWGLRTYLRTCRKLKLVPITSVKRGLKNEVLEVKHRGLSENEILSICNALTENAVVRTLDLEGNHLGPKACHYLALTFKENSTIEILNLTNTGLDHKCTPMIAHLLLRNETIKHVDLSENLFDDCDIPYLETVIQRSKYIEYLNLSHNNLGEEAAKHISHSIAVNEVISEFDLSWNRFRDKSIKYICKGLQENVALTKLNLAMNGLALEGVKAIDSLLLVNTTLQELDLTCTRIIDDGAFLLGKMLEKNETLRILKVSQNPMTHVGVYALLVGIERNLNSVMQSLDVLSVHILQSTIEKYTEVREVHPSFRLIHGRVVDDEAPLEPLKLHVEDSNEEEDPSVVLRRHLVVKRSKLVDVFRNMNLGPKPVLSKEVFKKGIKTLKIPLTSSQIDRLAETVDRGNKEQIDFSKLILRDNESIATIPDDIIIPAVNDETDDRPPSPPRKESFITAPSCL